MKDVKCPFCNVTLDAATVKDGWCAECGKALPRFTRHQNDPPPDQPQKRARRRAVLLWAVLFLVFAPLGFLSRYARDGKLGAAGDVVKVIVGVFFVVCIIASFVSLFISDRDSSPPPPD